MTRVALLGVKGGPAIRPGAPMPTSSLLQMAGKTVVVDCALGVSQGLIQQGIGVHEVDMIFITHLHSDHYLELGPLLHTAWTAGLKQKVVVYGPAGLDAYFDGFFASMKADIDLRIEDEGRPDLRGLIDLRLMPEGATDIAEGLRVRTMRNVHPPLVDTFALRFEAGSESVVFSGDTAAMPEMVDFAKDADLLVHEAMLTAGIDALCARVGNGDDRLKTHLLRSHCPAADVAKIAQAAGVSQLALNHLVPCDDPDFTEAHWRAEVTPYYTGKFWLGHDGLSLPI